MHDSVIHAACATREEVDVPVIRIRGVYDAGHRCFAREISPAVHQQSTPGWVELVTRFLTPTKYKLIYLIDVLASEFEYIYYYFFLGHFTQVSCRIATPPLLRRELRPAAH